MSSGLAVRRVSRGAVDRWVVREGVRRSVAARREREDIQVREEPGVTRSAKASMTFAVPRRSTSRMRRGEAMVGERPAVWTIVRMWGGGEEEEVVRANWRTES